MQRGLALRGSGDTGSHWEYVLKSYMGWQIDFSRPRGEASFAAPGSVHWRVFANPVALGIGGVCAVLLEFADPRIRSGVWNHSTFSTDPIGRGRRTMMAAQIGVFGPRSAAQEVIGRINRMHAKVSGETPGGVPYAALDTELLDWVAATATYGFVMAYHRFVRRLSDEQIDGFFAGSVEVGGLYGARDLPTSLAEFERMGAERLAGFEPHPINQEFLDIARSTRVGRGVPRWLKSDFVNASIAILPPEVRSVLQLGPEYDLAPSRAAMIRCFGRLADMLPRPTSPAGRASVRLGLPATFPWMSTARQARWLERRPAAAAAG